MSGLYVQKPAYFSGSAARRIGWIPLIVAGALALAVTTASAQTLTPLYAFTGGSDGAFPYGGLIVDASSNLYGTTYAGGGQPQCGGCGVVFKVMPSGTESSLHSFTGFATGDGQYPAAGLIMDTSGNLYGTTEAGGSGGTVFEVTPTGSEAVLYPFNGGSSSGQYPAAGLIMDASGNLYGTTEYGGAHGFGTVFKIVPKGSESVLYSFTGGNDGGYPAAGLIMDASGNLYGTTSNGGNLTGCYAAGCGVVFEVTPTGSASVLYTFTGGSDGGYPVAGLIADAAGNFYGTAAEGGNLSECSGAGCGVVFKLTPSRSETVLYAFAGGSDGAYPAASLIMDASGILYGTATEAGKGVGTVFKVTPTTTGGTESTLYTFTGGSDGAYPYAGLISDTSGNLYGTTSEGGNLTDCHGYGCGVVFKLSGTGFVPPAPPVHFAGVPGTANCQGVSVSTLTHTYGGMAHAAAALGYSSVNALQNAIRSYCGGS